MPVKYKLVNTWIHHGQFFFKSFTRVSKPCICRLQSTTCLILTLPSDNTLRVFREALVVQFLAKSTLTRTALWTTVRSGLNMKHRRAVAANFEFVTTSLTDFGCVCHPGVLRHCYNQQYIYEINRVVMPLIHHFYNGNYFLSNTNPSIQDWKSRKLIVNK